MNSEWFIFKGTHHIGPFSTTEIEVMFRRGDISRSILIWKEGEKSWEPLNKVTYFKHLFENENSTVNSQIEEIPKIVVKIVDQVPDDIDDEEIPPVPSDVITAPKKLPKSINAKKTMVPKEVPDNKAIINQDEDLPPPLPLDVFGPNFSEVKDKELKIKRPLFNNKFKGVKSFDPTQIILFGIGLVFIIVVAKYYLFQSKNETHFNIKNLMPANLEKLETAAQDGSSKPKIAMALSLDGKVLYLATNLNDELDVNIKLTSVQNRILGEHGGNISFKGRILNKLGSFSKVYNSDGYFSPGEYEYEIRFNQKHFLNSFFPAFYKMGLTRKLNKQYSLKGKELIYSGTRQSYEEKIQNYLDEKRNKKLRPLVEKKERFETVKSILNQMLTSYYDKLDKAKSGKDLKNFQEYVQKNISPILQNMVVSNSNFLIETNTSIKNVAEFSLLLSEQYKVLKKIKVEDKVKLKEQVGLKASEIENIINVEIEKVELEIQSLTK